MYEHSIDKAIKSKMFKNIVLVIQKSHFKFVKKHKKVKIALEDHIDMLFNALKFCKKI